MKNICLICVYILAMANMAHGQILTGAQQTDKYINALKGKRVGLVVNQTSVINGKHLVDSLIKRGIKVKKIFAPEHGFRGNAENGAKINNSVDPKSGVPIVSLYGKNYKPTAAQLKDLDIIVFDIQDIGVRCYTFVSTLHYVMEACAENKKPVLVLDRPNPNIYYTAGCVLENDCKSFVGIHPIPLVYGLTIAELATMINGEKWLKNGIKANLTIVKLQNYTRTSQYILPIKPSPNLPNAESILLYPSLCIFEGTPISVARGTYFPFQALGHPSFNTYMFNFLPKAIDTMSVNPPYKNQTCYGIDLRNISIDSLYNQKDINYTYLTSMYSCYAKKDSFFMPFFDLLIGNKWAKQLIIANPNTAAQEINKRNATAMAAYIEKRKTYLVY